MSICISPLLLFLTQPTNQPAQLSLTHFYTFSLCRTPTIQINNVALLRKNTNEPRSEVLTLKGRRARRIFSSSHYQTSSSTSSTWLSIPTPARNPPTRETLSAISTPVWIRKRKSFLHFRLTFTFFLHHLPPADPHNPSCPFLLWRTVQPDLSGGV